MPISTFKSFQSGFPFPNNTHPQTHHTQNHDEVITEYAPPYSATMKNNCITFLCCRFIELFAFRRSRRASHLSFALAFHPQPAAYSIVLIFSLKLRVETLNSGKKSFKTVLVMRSQNPVFTFSLFTVTYLLSYFGSLLLSNASYTSAFCGHFVVAKA